jgi:energy-coupling factor transport system permease protein
MKLHPLTRIVIVIALSTTGIIYSGNFLLSLLLLICVALHIIMPANGLKKVIRNSAKLLPVILGVFIIQLVFSSKGKAILDFCFFDVTQTGLETAISVSLRLMIIFLSGIWLSNLSPREFNQAFRAVRLPEAIAVMITITLRFLPSLYARFKQVSFQLKVRGIKFQTWSLLKRIQLYRMLVFSVLGWAMKDLKFQAIALDIRGFRNGLKHTVYNQVKFTFPDYIIIAVSIALVFLPLVLY